MIAEINTRAFWLNVLDGLGLAWTRFRGEPECGQRNSFGVRLTCDLPAGHTGMHKARAYLSPFHRHRR